MLQRSNAYFMVKLEDRRSPILAVHGVASCCRGKFDNVVQLSACSISQRTL